MSRALSTLVVLFLLGGTAAAFAVTQGLKLEKTPVLAPEIDKVFSPVCACESRKARIAFRLREADTVSVAIVDGGGEVVRELVRERRHRAGRVNLAWNGRDDAGHVVSDSAYRPRVRLADAHRTIEFPNDIRVDTERPRIELVGVGRRVVSPDGDGRGDGVSIRYQVSEPAHGVLEVGPTRVRTRWQRLRGNVQWYGKARGRPLPPRTYTLGLYAEDRAGNTSRVLPIRIRVRYIELRRDVIRAKAGTRFGVRVDTDARSYRWRFAGRVGTARARYLVLRAQRPGRFRLYVATNRHADVARVVVGRRS